MSRKILSPRISASKHFYSCSAIRLQACAVWPSAVIIKWCSCEIILCVLAVWHQAQRSRLLLIGGVSVLPTDACALSAASVVFGTASPLHGFTFGSPLALNCLRGFQAMFKFHWAWWDCCQVSCDLVGSHTFLTGMLCMPSFPRRLVLHKRWLGLAPHILLIRIWTATVTFSSSHKAVRGRDQVLP